MTFGLCVLRIIVENGVRVLGLGFPGPYQKVDLLHVAPCVAQAEQCCPEKTWCGFA